MLVSVIMPTYNCAAFIEESILSVINQTITDWELLIVDDCSTDNTEEVVKPYCEEHSNIRYKRLESNGGPQKARNVALAAAQGRYIAFLDSDDLWASNKLEKQLEFMKNNKAFFSATAYEHIEESGVRKMFACFPPQKCNYGKMLRLSNPIGNSTVMYDQVKVGRQFVPDIKKRNDFALWLKILKKTKYCYGMQEVLTSYRVRQISVSSNKLGQAKYHWKLYYEIEGLGIIKSSFYMLCWAWVKGTEMGLNRKKI